MFMKRLIITDLHGRSANALINEMKTKHGIDSYACLGDVESPEVMEELLHLGEDKMLLIPGNHDFPYMVDCCKILKGTAVDRTKKADYLPCNENKYWQDVEKWANTPILRNFAQQIVNDYENENRFQKTFQTKQGNVVCVHASIFDDSDIYEELRLVDQVRTEDEPYQLWARMHNAMGQVNGSVITGTLEMLTNPSEEMWMMFRGHDWGQRAYSLDKNSPTFSNYESSWNPCADKLDIKLSSDKVYIASFGSYKQGQYGIFDDENMTLEFYNPERKDAWGE
jgi:hypothetical protein